MEGWGWQSVHDPQELPGVLEEWKHSIATGVPFDMTFPLRSSTGEFRSFLTRVIPVRDSDEKIIRWFGTNTDIQDQKETEQALAVATENAKLAVRARDEFMSIASHELKTPLTSLRLQVQLRARNLSKGDFAGFTPEKIGKMLEIDNRQIDRISRLIDDMLDVSRINTGKLTMVFERFDLCSLAEEVLSHYRHQFETLGSNVSLVCCDPVEGYWDRFRIEQAIANLLMNAVKYGGGRPVEVSVGHQHGRAILRVRDQGIGIAKENFERIFQRFERAVVPSDVSGMGLGLFITKQIVEIHGGSVKVESEPGKGSTFILELPMANT
jgi:signal transduction histidine kinase